MSSEIEHGDAFVQSYVQVSGIESNTVHRTTDTTAVVELKQET